MPICKIPNGDLYFFSKYHLGSEFKLGETFNIHIPKSLRGKRVRVKFEVVEDEAKK